jgi:hypothetical protein
MIITKVYETTITVENPILFSSRYTNIIAYIKNEFEGKCFKSSLILSIREIIKCSDCVISQNDMFARGSVDVCFKASALIYSPGEIIHNCKIVKKESGMIFAINENCNIYILQLSAHKLAQSYKLGQYISIIVKGSLYSTFKSEISINGDPFLHSSFDVERVFSCSGTPDKSVITLIIKNIEKENIKLSKISDKKRLSQISDVVESYSKIPKNRSEDITRLIKSNAKYLRVYTNGGYEILKTAVGETLLQTATFVYSLILMEILRKKQTICELCEIYSSEEKFDNHSNVWLSITKSKL